MERMQEADLVRESLYALQGLPSAVRRLERLASVYLATDADIRALRAAGTIWNRTASSNAVGKLLLEFADSGRVRCSLDLFVNFFLDDKPSFSTDSKTKPKLRGCTGSIAAKAQRKQVKELQRKRWAAYRQVKLASRGLVNQAFAKAVRSISLGHNEALSALLTSVSQRRSGSRNQVFDNRFKNGQDGVEGSIELRDVTLLELFLHTKELRNQLQALSRICFSQRDSNPGWNSDFLCGEPYVIHTGDGRIRLPMIEELVLIYSQWHDFLLVVQEFPRGATLLSYLHSKLLDADSLQAKVLRFLFARAWRPYSVFVESWLYHATVTDPHAEFIVEESNVSKPIHLFSSAESLDRVPAEVKVRDEGYIPSFLREVAIPLIRAGQQLQVLLKLPETRDFAQRLPGYIFLTDPALEAQETAGSLWPEQRSKSSLFSTLGFSKAKLDKGLQLREERNRVMAQHFNQLFKGLMLKVTSKKDEEDRSTDQLMADGELFCDSFSEFLDASQGEYVKSGELSLHDSRSHSMYVSVELEDILWTALEGEQTSVGDSRLCNEQPGAGKESESDADPIPILTPAFPTDDPQWEHESTDEQSCVSVSLVRDMPANEQSENQVVTEEPEAYLCVSNVITTCEDSGLDTLSPLSIHRRSGCSNESTPDQDSAVCNTYDKLGGNSLPVQQYSSVRRTEMSAGGAIDLSTMQSTSSLLDAKEVSLEVNSILLAGSENEVLALQSKESLLSDYLKETWSVSELPYNPFLVSSTGQSSMSHMYGSISFPESENNWDLDSKFLDKGVYSKRYFVQAPRDPLRRERRILAELPFVNYTEFAFLDKHMSHSQEKSRCLEYSDGSSYRGGSALQRIEYAPNERDSVDFDHANSSREKIRNNVGLGDVFQCLDEVLFRERMHRRTWQLHDICVVEDLRTSVLESAQSLSGESFEGALESITTAFQQKGEVTKSEDGDALGHGESNLVFGEETMSDTESARPPFGDMHREGDCNGIGNHVTMKGNGLPVDNSRNSFASVHVHEGNAQSTSQNPESAASELQAQETDCGIDGEIPFAVVLDKCIIQEIILQYQSVSLFTVKVLQDGLHLRAHYAALRRYFFMETADWADNFVAALCNHRWRVLGGRSDLLVIQGMLESSLQRSSCEGDEFAERLYIASFGANDLISPSGHSESERLQIFQSTDLRYRVSWPLTLVLTSTSLKRYGAIFSFFLGIKSAVHILSSIYQSLKGIKHDLKDKIARCQHQKNCFRMLQVFRCQVCHFVTSLQRYLESKLLHVVWSQFLQSTELQEQDIYDLEVLHSEYLDEAENCCFTSNDTAGVKTSVDKILQLVFYFESHLRIASSDVYGNLLSDLLHSQVLRLHLTFQESIRQLHLCSTRPEYRSSLSDFWMCLDHNGFFENAYATFQ